MNSSVTRISPHARVRARRSAVQALYQWEICQSSMPEVIKEFCTDRGDELKKADIEYFNEIALGAADKSEILQTEIEPLLTDRKINELDPVERAILLIGTYELMFHPELPWRVVVNESIELAKMFGADQSHKYINGVMDKLAHKIRTVEIANTG